MLLACFFMVQGGAADLPLIVTHPSGVEFKRCSQQKITKALFFDVLKIGLYYPDCKDYEGILDDNNKLLRFYYLRDVKGSQFTEGAIEYLDYNLTDDEKKDCLANYQAINTRYRDVSEGDFYDLYLFQSTGLELYLNKVFLGKMSKLSCDSHYLKIWFGEESMDSGFRRLLEKIK